MKTSKRKWLGAVLIVAAIVAGVVLQLSGLGLLGIKHESAPNIEWLGIHLHWSLFIVGAVAVVGLLCLVLPWRSHHPDAGSTTR